MRIIVEEECALCHVTYPSFLLHRCIICGRLYCNNCILFEDGKPICLRCAKRRVSPVVSWRSKYAYLREYLAKRAKYSSYVKLSFKKIEEIMNDRLPPSALNDPRWWSNTHGKPHSESWLSVGWKVDKVELDEKTVTFVRAEPTQTRRGGRKKRKRISSAFKALALKPKRRRRRPSKRKIAEMKARIENIKRQMASEKRIRGLKPRSAYEKRLYKFDEKPR